MVLDKDSNSAVAFLDLGRELLCMGRVRIAYQVGLGTFGALAGNELSCVRARDALIREPVVDQVEIARIPWLLGIEPEREFAR